AAETIEARDARIEERKRQEGVRIDEAKRKEAKLSDKDTNAIGQFDTGLEMLKTIQREKPQFDTGPVAGRLHTMAGKVGLQDPKKAAFLSGVLDQFNEH